MDQTFQKKTEIGSSSAASCPPSSGRVLPPLSNMEQVCQKEATIGSSSAASGLPSSGRPHLTKPQIQRGFLYEINHSGLPPYAPIHLRDIRVALVWEKTNLNIGVRFPSKESLLAFLRYTTRETHPTMDESFVMRIAIAEKMLGKLVSPESFSKDKAMETFWLGDTVDDEEGEDEECDTNLKSVILGDTVVKKLKILENLEVNKNRSTSRGSGLVLRDRWIAERTQLNAEARNKIDCLLMHMTARAELNIDERFSRHNPERPMEYWVECIDFSLAVKEYDSIHDSLKEVEEKLAKAAEKSKLPSKSSILAPPKEDQLLKAEIERMTSDLHFGFIKPEGNFQSQWPCIVKGKNSTDRTLSEQKKIAVEEDEEPILMEQSQNYCMFPVKYPQLWEMYNKAEASFWTAKEVDLSNDVQQWEALTQSEKHFVSHVLAFFAASDGIVLENLAARFMNDIKIAEARVFYRFQMDVENIHSEMYSLLLDTYIKDSDEKNRLFNAIENIPCVARKAKWAFNWINSSSSFAERLVAFACVEGIFFSGRFCAILWLKKRGMMPGLTFSNELISRDKGLHCDFACLLYGLLRKQLHWERVHLIVQEAVDIETEFVCDALPCALIGMNSDLMGRHIKFVADRLVVALGYERMYNVGNPFDWMEFKSLRRNAAIDRSRAPVE